MKIHETTRPDLLAARTTTMAVERPRSPAQSKAPDEQRSDEGQFPSVRVRSENSMFTAHRAAAPDKIHGNGRIIMQRIGGPCASRTFAPTRALSSPEQPSTCAAAAQRCPAVTWLTLLGAESVSVMSDKTLLP